MKRFILIIYLAMVALLGLTTIIEHRQGTAFVTEHVYGTAWFCAAWALLALLLVMAVVKSGLFRRLPMLMLHASFLVILGGAALTFLTSKKGYIHLTTGQTVTFFTDDDNHTLHALPFALQLDTFEVRCYPGTEAPADYVSRLRVTTEGAAPQKAEVAMNRIFVCQGYRFYQSSFDDDRNGSWLAVNYDPWGTSLSYFGYLLLALSMVGVLASRKEEFRRLLNHPLLRKSALAVALMLGLCPNLSARTQLPAFNREKADSLALRQVIYNDRVAPFNTLARDFVVKITGQTSFRGLTPEQVVSGWLLRPDAWQHEPMILVKSSELRQILHIDGKYARFTDFFDTNGYILQRYDKGHSDPMQSSASPSSPLQKAIEETDERVGLILMLTNGTLIRPLPTDGSVRPLSDTRLKAELIYNRWPLTRVLFMANLTLGILAFGLLIARGTNRQRSPRAQRFDRAARRGTESLMWLSTLTLAFTYGLRWYIAHRVPLSNGYETMLFLALCTSALACLLQRRFAVAQPFGFLLSGFALLVSHLGQMNPQITPLVPVLVSPWLSIHVSLVMLSYALLAFIMLNGITALCLPREAERLMLFSRLMLYPAVFLLGIGIFMGAVWANQSWGSYWSWDPKETWALITFMIYALAFHSQSLPWFRQPRHFHWFAVLAFLTVVMTYVGVNYFLTGMHSYA